MMEQLTRHGLVRQEDRGFAFVSSVRESGESSIIEPLYCVNLYSGADRVLCCLISNNHSQSMDYLVCWSCLDLILELEVGFVD